MNANSNGQNNLDNENFLTKRLSGALVVMFVDICGSTRLFADFGDEAALAKTTRCLQSLQSIIKEHTGKVINTFGDGLLCTFPAPDCALNAALSFYSELQNQEVAIHGGLHLGTVIAQGDSIYGNAVNIASRLADLAKDGEILLSKDFMQNVSPHLRHHARDLGALSLKGNALPLQTYLLSSDTGTETAFQTAVVTSELQSKLELQLGYRGQTITLSTTSTDFSFGRLPSSNLMVASTYASRRHATIDCNRSKFTLTDHSSNGSFIRDQDNSLSVIKRETHQLQGSGVISLGIDPVANPEHLIEYCLISSH